MVGKVAFLSTKPKRKGVRRYSGGRLFVCSKVIGKKHKKFPKDGKQGFFVPSGVL